MKTSTAATVFISLLTLLPCTIEPIDAKICVCQPVKRVGVATTTYRYPFSTPNRNTAVNSNAAQFKLVRPANAVRLDNIKRQSDTDDNIEFQSNAVFQDVRRQPGTIFQNNKIQQSATVLQNDILRQPGTVSQNNIIQQTSTTLQNGAGIGQPGIVSQDNIIQQTSTALQNGAGIGQSGNAIEDDVVQQPAMEFQNDVLNQPAELILHDNIVDQITSAEKSLYVDHTSLDFIYWNSELGNDHPIAIEYNNETKMINNWLEGKPLKVITHGWQASDEDDSGVFAIKKAYITIGGYNVITADWSEVASNLMYPMPAYLTAQVGAVIAKLLENFVKLNLIHPYDIHILGHSLGAHVAGACGAAFSLGKIGRITGLDAAGPGFEYVTLWSDRLDSSDAEFVDVIHTAVGTLGFAAPLGTADFYPNGGTTPQLGCFDSYLPNSFINFVSCSHSRAHELYTESVYNKNSFKSVKCESWVDYMSGSCKDNEVTLMGHYVDLNARGIYYLKTNSTSPFSILDLIES